MLIIRGRFLVSLHPNLWSTLILGGLFRCSRSPGYPNGHRGGDAGGCAPNVQKEEMIAIMVRPMT